MEEIDAKRKLGQSGGFPLSPCGRFFFSIREDAVREGERTTPFPQFSVLAQKNSVLPQPHVFIPLPTTTVEWVPRKPA